MRRRELDEDRGFFEKEKVQDKLSIAGVTQLDSIVFNLICCASRRPGFYSFYRKGSHFDWKRIYNNTAFRRKREENSVT